YQIPLGSFTCLPRGCGPSSLGSHTLTISSCSPLPSSNSLMLKVNGSYPPLCSPAFCPFTNTSACQSTAPKCNNISCRRMVRGTVKLVLYQRALSFPTRSPTPDNADSTAKGTRISPSQADGSPESAAVIA